MTSNIRILASVSVCLLIALLITRAIASPLAKELSWPELIPDQPVFDDPFASLTSDQLYDLSLVARVRELEASGGKVTESDIAERSEATARLSEQGVDVEGLLAKRQEVTAKRRAAAEAVVPGLDGEQVRIPGYLLPLEFDGTATTEFLLVPYVGACIHVPPPPPNQIVHVKFDSGYENPGMFTPVWVEGHLSAEVSSKSLYLVDGTADVGVGYQIAAEAVERYERP